MILKKRNIIDYMMLIILIFISGNITFTSKSILFITFILSGLVFFYRNAKFDRTFIYFLTILLVILLFQSLKFNFFPLETYIGVFIRILIAYFILKSIGVTFIDKFVKVMYYIAISSLIFYFSILLIPSLEQLLIDKFTTFAIVAPNKISRYSVLGLYTIIPDAPNFIKSNSGPFWEMGAFGGYLMIAFIFSLLKNNNLKNKVNLIFFITILTTQSTTTYIALAVLLFFIYSKKIKNIFLKIMMSFLILLSSYYIYTNLEFLGKKIEHQIYMATLVNINNLQDADSQRFINILKDWNDFQGHEFIGRGPNSTTRYTSYNKENEIRTVGSTDMIVRYGLPFFLLMIFLIYLSINAYTKYLNNNFKVGSASIVIVILILLMSETYFLYPLFWILVLHQYIYKNKKFVRIKNEKNINWRQNIHE